MDTPINQQTVSPLHEGGPGQLMDAYGNLVATCQSYGAGIMPQGYVAPWHLTEPNARLFRASFNAFDKAGRELGLDAATLAAETDVAALIRFRAGVVACLDKLSNSPLSFMDNIRNGVKDTEGCMPKVRG